MQKGFFFPRDSTSSIYDFIFPEGLKVNGVWFRFALTVHTSPSLRGNALLEGKSFKISGSWVGDCSEEPHPAYPPPSQALAY